MQYVKLTNRTSQVLNGVWDGRQYAITPGEHSFPEVQAVKFKEQNPIMGSENPYTMQKEYLIGIEELGDDVSPVEQTNAKERWNRGMLQPREGMKFATEKGNGTFAPAIDKPNRLPASEVGFEANSGFEKP